MISKSKARCVKFRMREALNYGSVQTAHTATRKLLTSTDILKENISLWPCLANFALKHLIAKKLWLLTRKSIWLIFLDISSYFFFLCCLDLDSVVKFKMIEIVDPSGKKSWSCSDCGYTSNKTTNMYKHWKEAPSHHTILWVLSETIQIQGWSQCAQKNPHPARLMWFSLVFNITNMCNFSIISFLVSAEIQREIDSKMEPTSKGWGCRVCGFDSNNKTRTWEHVEAKHVDTGGYNCRVCSKFCKSTSSLRPHG